LQNINRIRLEEIVFETMDVLENWIKQAKQLAKHSLDNHKSFYRSLWFIYPRAGK